MLKMIFKTLPLLMGLLFSSFTSQSLIVSKKNKPIVHLENSNANTTIHRFLLITGCARSGTTYISELLKLSGLDIEHELIGKDGTSSWFMCIEADRVPWKPRPSALGFQFDHVFHQVRHPLKVISSVFSTEHYKAISYFSENIPEIYATDTRLVKCAKYWYYWNLYAEQKAEWRFQVEQIDSCLEEMGHRLGITIDKNVLSQVPKDSNHRKKTINLTWAQLQERIPTDLFIKIQEMAVRYGYSISD